jgi:hypothetical protein
MPYAIKGPDGIIISTISVIDQAAIADICYDKASHHQRGQTLDVAAAWEDLQRRGYQCVPVTVTEGDAGQIQGVSVLADAVLGELIGRRGFSQAWDDCDDDIRQEIRQCLCQIIDAYLKGKP